MIFKKCKWRQVGELAYWTTCTHLIAAENLRGAFPIVYCPNCGKKIKVVEE